MIEIDVAARQKAYQLRRLAKAGPLDNDDTDWLNEYEASKSPKGAHAKKASKIFHMEEHAAEASGDGDTVAQVMAATGYAREDGRRLDSIIGIALSAMQRACDINNRMMEQMMRRSEQSESTVNDLLVSIRTHYLNSAQMETRALLAERQAQLDRINLESGGDEEDNGPLKMFETAIVNKLAGNVANAVSAPSVPK